MEKKMNKFRQWYLTNQTEITWFIIGFLVLAGFQDLTVGNYLGAVLSFGLAWINYSLNK
jgi:uncharacterized membrane protein YkgB